MPDISDSTFISEKNANKNKPIWLYEIQDYDGADNNLYFAAYYETITFAGNSYSPYPIKHEIIGSNISGEIDSVSLVVANVDRVIQSYLETYDVRGKKVIISMVWSNQLATSTAILSYSYYIDSYVATAKSVTFTCSSIIDVLDLSLPNGFYNLNYCRWRVFKGTECGYDGAETTCNRTLQQCREYGNTLRFGGFPSITGRRLMT